MWFVFLEFAVNDTRILNLPSKINCKQDIITVNRQLQRSPWQEEALPEYKHPGDVWQSTACCQGPAFQEGSAWNPMRGLHDSEKKRARSLNEHL